MIFGSVCSGIEAASCAWHPLGWRAAFVSDIEKFPSAVLAHHYPDVPNYGDMTKFKDWPDESIDLLVGGTPCQSFSVAGLRKGLADPRGNLMLTYLAIADRYRPRWLVWENVPGVLSSNGGRDFGTFLGALGQLGYGFAYRVLDAQYFGVPQRRRRVFVVGYLGDWRRAAAVLFERHSLQGHPPPRREAGEGASAPTAPSLTASGRGVEQTGESRGQNAESETFITHSLRADGFDASEDGPGRGTPLVPVAFEWQRGDTQNMDLHVNFSPALIKSQTPAFYSITPSNSNKDYNARLTDKAQAVTAGGNRPSARGGDLISVPTLTSNGDAHSGVRDEHGLVPVAFAQNTRDEVRLFGGAGEIAGALAAEPGTKQQTYLAYDLRGREGGSQFEGPHDTANIRAADGGSSRSYVAFDTYNQSTDPHVNQTLQRGTGTDQIGAILSSSAVRRLTPRECERLQGFPDDYTLIPYRGKPAADGPRYKALGNSMAVPVMRWIGERIAEVDKIISPPLK